MISTTRRDVEVSRFITWIRVQRQGHKHVQNVVIVQNWTEKEMPEQKLSLFSLAFAVYLLKWNKGKAKNNNQNFLLPFHCYIFLVETKTVKANPQDSPRPGTAPGIFLCYRKYNRQRKAMSHSFWSLIKAWHRFSTCVTLWGPRQGTLCIIALEVRG